MFQLRFRLNRVTVVGAVAVGMAVAASSFGIVRAERAPDSEGSSTGVSTAGVYGTASLADGVHGVTSGAGSSSVSGISIGRRARPTAFTAGLQTARVSMERPPAATASRATPPRMFDAKNDRLPTTPAMPRFRVSRRAR
ncbi:MAG: hypothetical protein WCC84_13885 [Candidatus Cybelea sp.]